MNQIQHFFFCENKKVVLKMKVKIFFFAKVTIL